MRSTRRNSGRQAGPIVGGFEGAVEAMAVVLEYASDYRSFAAQSAHLHAAAFVKARRAYYLQLANYSFVIGAGFYCAFQAQAILFCILFGLLLLRLLAFARPYSVIQQRSIEATKSNFPESNAPS